MQTCVLWCQLAGWNIRWRILCQRTIAAHLCICCPHMPNSTLCTAGGPAGTRDEEPEDGVGWGEPAQSQWLLECAGGGPSAALAAAAAAAGGSAGRVANPGPPPPQREAPRCSDRGQAAGDLENELGDMAWAARHRMYVRVRRGEMRLATVIVAEP